MDTFVYEEGELLVSKTQCGLCMLYNPENPVSCEKYETKPEEIMNGERKCPFIVLPGVSLY